MTRNTENRNSFDADSPWPRALLEAMPDAVMVFDAEGRLKAVNRQAVELLQCTTEQLLGKTARDLLIPVDPSEQLSDALQDHPVERALRSQDPIENICLETRVQQGGPIRLAGRVAAVTDATMTHGAILSLTVEPANRGAFLAGMSHEIRTPLNSLLGMLQLLEQGELTPEQHEAVHIALDSGRCLLEIVNDILDLARIEIGAMTLAQEPFDPAGILSAVAELFTPVAEDKEIELLVDAPPPTHLCLGDAARLRQILFNLIGHAMRHTESGRIQLKLSQQPSGSEPCTQLEFLISVHDTEASAPGQIAFTPSPCAPVTGMFRETGLGLPIAQRLIAAMGGTIALKPLTRGGSEARVTLAFKQGAPLAAEDIFDEQLPSLQILLVEDDKVNQLATRRLLGKAGHKVVSTDDGGEALTALDQIRFDLILMDGAMPNLDGLETTRRIRASQRPYAAIPIIALTAHALQGDRERFLEAGMDDYLAKPLEFKEFNKTVARILKNRE